MDAWLESWMDDEKYEFFLVPIENKTYMGVVLKIPRTDALSIASEFLSTGGCVNPEGGYVGAYNKRLGSIDSRQYFEYDEGLGCKFLFSPGTANEVSLVIDYSRHGTKFSIFRRLKK